MEETIILSESPVRFYGLAADGKGLFAVLVFSQLYKRFVWKRAFLSAAPSTQPAKLSLEKMGAAVTNPTLAIRNFKHKFPEWSVLETIEFGS